MPEWHKQLLTYLYILSMYYEIKYLIILCHRGRGTSGPDDEDAEDMGTGNDDSSNDENASSTDDDAD